MLFGNCAQHSKREKIIGKRENCRTTERIVEKREKIVGKKKKIAKKSGTATDENGSSKLFEDTIKKKQFAKAVIFPCFA